MNTDMDIAAKTPDGYIIERPMPGFQVWKGKRCIEQSDSSTDSG